MVARGVRVAMSIRSDAGVCLGCGAVFLVASMVRVASAPPAFRCGECDAKATRGAR